MQSNLLAWGAALGACVPLLATAQAPKAEPPKVAGQLTYQSAFADYKSYKDVPLGTWRELNDTVAGAPGEASGHAGHSMGDMNETEMPGMPAAPASAPMQMKTMPMHEGHPKMGGTP